MNNLHRVLGAVAVITLIAPVLVSAQTTGSTTIDIQVQSLLGQITSLEQQLKTLVQSVAPSSTIAMWDASSTPPAMNGGSGAEMGGCPSFGRNLSVGSQGSDVMQLQQMLSGEGFFSASTTGYFGSLTANALNEFQAHFDISTSSAGFFGPLTRAFVGAHCQGTTGSSTPPAMHPMIPVSTSTPFWGGPGPVIMSSTSVGIFHGPMGSSTAPNGPSHPCPQNADQGAAAVLFVPHVILPMFLLNPCEATSSAAQ